MVGDAPFLGVNGASALFYNGNIELFGASKRAAQQVFWLICELLPYLTGF
jgi:hypothetical protein